MTREGFEKRRAWFLAHPAALRALKFLNNALPAVVYCAYPTLLAVLFFKGDARLLRVAAVPAAALAAVTLARKLFDFPRPTESLGIEPLSDKKKKGDSFPSRHAAAATSIAAAFLYISLPLGLIMLLIALSICILRPTAGIHFPRDVMAGALLGAVIGVIGFILI